MDQPLTRVLVVDDYEPWRRFVRSTLQQRPELQVIGEASDGAEAIQKAKELQPDLILLDIGLPTVNGIQAAREIRLLVPKSRILFLTAIRSADIAGEALCIGANGFVIKSAAGEELWLAIEAVLQGKQFVSSSLLDHRPHSSAEQGIDASRQQTVAAIPRASKEIGGHHAVGFHSDEASLVREAAQFIGAALRSGLPAVIVATESHREDLLQRLQTDGINVRSAIEQGKYIAVDADYALSTFMFNGMPDSARFLKCFGDLIVSASDTAKTANGERPCVAVFGEGVQRLWEQGNVQAAIQVEKLGNQLLKTYDVDILCAYSLHAVQGGMDDHVFQCICAEHSAVCGHDLCNA